MYSCTKQKKSWAGHCTSAFANDFNCILRMIFFLFTNNNNSTTSFAKFMIELQSIVILQKKKRDVDDSYSLCTTM